MPHRLPLVVGMLALLLCGWAVWGQQPAGPTVYLESLDLGNMSQQYGQPRPRQSVDGNPLRLGGQTYQHGVGSHAAADLELLLGGRAVSFRALVGVDDERTGQGSVTFEVWVDGKPVADSGVMHGGDPPKALAVDLRGAESMFLVVTDAGDGISNDHADWADAAFTMQPGAEPPQTRPFATEPPPAIATGTRLEPAIHGPRVVGGTPNRPFLFLVPATGEGPLRYAADNLPAGLVLDPQAGIISGKLQRAGTTIVGLTVTGPHGVAHRKLKIVAGTHKLAQTPPLGWNSWNVWAGAVDAEKVREAADYMVSSGLAAHGFAYINIDDTWEAGRDESGEILTNAKFPDMKALADYVHSKGLKLGIYSSPGPKTCGGFTGSFGHEAQDARTYARWGIDYLKYDWCSCESKDLQAPYRLMRSALDHCGRDIVYSLCQYGMGNVWEWGEGVGANCWRTTGDITDSWGSMASIGFAQGEHSPYAGPGHWNDPDMLVVGKLGWSANPHPTHLTPNEQLTHITLWSMLSSPLLLGCDLAQLDQFTIDLVTNDEVLDVNQDPLGKPAGRKSVQGRLEVWARPLWDGTLAVALFNRGLVRSPVTARWQDLGLAGSQPVRDLWRQQDLGSHRGSFTAQVPPHGAVLVKIGRPTRTDW